MATYTYGERTRTRTVVATLVRQGLIVVLTGVEAIALVLWLSLLREASPLSRLAAAGFGVLALGLLVEHVLTDLAVNDFDVSVPGVAAAALSASEALIWGLWLLIAGTIGGLVGLLVAGGLFAALLVPQHTIEDSVLRGRDPLADIANVEMLGYSVVEAVGAVLWLLFVTRPDLVEPILVEAGLTAAAAAPVGAGILATALLIEHEIGVHLARR